MTTIELLWKQYWRLVCGYTVVVWSGVLFMIPIVYHLLTPTLAMVYSLLVLIALFGALVSVVPKLHCWMSEPAAELRRIAQKEEAESLRDWEMPSVAAALLRLCLVPLLLAYAFLLLVLWGIFALTPIFAVMVFIKWLAMGEPLDTLLCLALAPTWAMAMWLPPTVYSVFLEKPWVKDRIDAWWSRLPTWAQ